MPEPSVQDWMERTLAHAMGRAEPPAQPLVLLEHAGVRFGDVLALLHERFGVLTVMLTAFGRAVSEVGAVMIVGGNIDGFTRVMTTAIALETSKGDLPLALALGVVLLGVVGVINLVISAVQGRTSLEREAYA